MITEAYIAGDISKAIFKKDGAYFIVDSRNGRKILGQPINQFDLNNFILVRPEINSYKNIEWTDEMLYQRLYDDSSKMKALSLFLMGMDKSLDDDIKAKSLKVLSSVYLSNKDIEIFVRNRAFATVLPSGFDPSHAAKIAVIERLDVSKWYYNLFYGNNIIATVRDKWMKTLFSLANFPTSNIEILDKFFTDRGVFADFVLPIISHNYREVDSAILKHSITLNELSVGINPGLFLNDLKVAVFKALSVNLEVIADRDLEKIKLEDDKFVSNAEDEFENEFHKAIDQFIGKTKRKKLSWKGLKPRIARVRGFFDREINSSINWIKEKIHNGYIRDAERGILELIENQDINSDAHHLCKSLCDIATSFQKIRDFERSDLLASKAKNLNDMDSVPSTILAESCRLQGKLEEALSRYEDIITEFSHQVIPRAGRAEILRQMGRLDDALHAYEETISAFSDQIIPRTGRAEILRQMGRLDDALHAYEEIIRQYNDVVPRNGRAETLRQMGRLDDALHAYEETIRLFSNDVVARNGRAETLRQMGRLDDALHAYEETIKQYNDGFARNGRAETLRQMGRLDDALRAYEETISAFSDDVFARSGRAETLRQMGRLDDALHAYEEIIRQYNDVVPRNGRAETLRQMGRLDDALHAYEETIRLFSNDVVARTGRAETLRQMGRLDDALRAYEETISAFSNNVVARTGRAETLRQMGRLDDALHAYEETISAFSDSVVPRNGRAETLRQMGRLDDALHAYEETIKQYNDGFARNGRAETLRQMGRLDDALRAYEETISAFSDDVVARSGRAETLRQMGRLKDALHAYEEIIRQYNDVFARTGRAETLRQMGRLDDALHAYEETISVFSNNVVARSGKAETLRQMGRLDDALHAYEETIRLFSDDLVARNGRAETLRQMGRLDDALHAYEETIRLFSDSVVARTGRAETLRQMGRLDDALYAYEETISAFSNNAVARSGKAETLRQMGRLDDALRDYDLIIVDFPFSAIAKRARYVVLIELNKDLTLVQKATEVVNPKCLDDWKMLHIHCMLLLKIGKVDNAIAYLKNGVAKIEDKKSNNYYRGSLSYAYILKGNYRSAISQLKDKMTDAPIFEVLITHAYAEDKNIAEAKKHFNSIVQSAPPKIINVMHFLSDRYNLNKNLFLGQKSIQKLDSDIHKLEFELLTEPFLLAA